MESLVVANHELSNEDDFISEQYIELQDENLKQTKQKA